VIIRAESATDAAGIRAVVEAAFGRAAEAELIDQLRADGNAVISLVATQEDALVGHAMLSTMSAPFRALGLGPVAVSPGRQRRGVGRRLIEEGLARARAGAWQGVFVLGDPAYYRRFGFDAEAAAGFASPYAGPHFMALALGADALPIQSGSVGYAPAFARDDLDRASP
jgi:putative acetyltransferase